MAGKRVQPVIETHFARNRVMMVDQRPSVVEQHLPRYPAKALEPPFQAIKPRRLALMPEGPHKHPPRIPQRRDKQMYPHRVAADRYSRLAKVDLQLLARRRLKPQTGPRLGPQCLAQRRHGALHRAQRHDKAVLAQQILPHHIAIAAMLPKALGQPLPEPVKPRLANRHPAAGCEIPLHGITAAPQLARDPLGPPAQLVQPHHRRHLLRCQHHLSPPIQPPWRAWPLHHRLQFLLLTEGSVLMSSGGQFFMSSDR
jgi:hypothetical protein